MQSCWDKPTLFKGESPVWTAVTDLDLVGSEEYLTPAIEELEHILSESLPQEFGAGDEEDTDNDSKSESLPLTT